MNGIAEMNQVIMVAERVYKQLNVRAKVVNTLSSAQERLITLEAEAVTTRQKFYMQQSKVNAEIRQGTKNQTNFNNAIKQGAEEQKQLIDEIRKLNKNDYWKVGLKAGKRIYSSAVGDAMSLNKMEQLVMARSGSPELGKYYIQDWKKTARQTGTNFNDQMKLGMSFMPQVKNPRQVNDLMKLSQQIAAFDVSGKGSAGAAEAIKSLMGGDSSPLSKQMDIPKSVIEKKFGIVDAAKSGDLDKFIQKFKEMLEYMSMGEKQYKMLMDTPAMKAEAAVNGFKNSLAEAGMTAMQLLAPQLERVNQWLQSTQGQTFFMSLGTTIATVTTKFIEFIQWLNEGGRAVNFLTQLVSPQLLRIASILGLVALSSKIIVPVLGVASQGLAILSGWITRASVSTTALTTSQSTQIIQSQMCVGSAMQQATATGVLSTATNIANRSVNGLSWAVRGLSIALKAASVVGIISVLADIAGIALTSGNASEDAANLWNGSMLAMDATTVMACQNIEKNLRNMAKSAIEKARTVNAATGTAKMPNEVTLNPEGGGTVVYDDVKYIKDKNGKLWEEKMVESEVPLKTWEEVVSTKLIPNDAPKLENFATALKGVKWSYLWDSPVKGEDLLPSTTKKVKTLVRHTNINPADKMSALNHLNAKFEEEKRQKKLDELSRNIDKTNYEPITPTKVDKIGKVDSVGKIEEPVEIGSEDIKVMRELAEMRHIQNFVTLTPTVQVTTGDINHSTDINTIINQIENKLEEQFIGAAQGVYGY
ncbi:hypothetical protein BBG47_23005 [Paenibacillus sp. KS1]|uniref:hypothetical protein n=1 Tax=Paenibacillus sp. KS1 TaxID=1849249 RepID=UPI000806656E|nr:hypothetical protein [Paenibacillus sp. KS1]OBY77204.1 hypothetical protein BBG47_23005 [Paenibacillus sp. KS1]